MEEEKKVCEAISLGRSKEDLDLLQNCNEFPNLEQITIEEEASRIFVESPKNFPKLKKLIGLPYDISNSAYDYNEYSEDCDMKRILNEITRFMTLEEIDIDEWELFFLPESFSNLENLKKLSINDSSLLRLPEAIGYLPNLRKLDLGNYGKNSITSPNEFTLPETIGNLENLEELNLAYCGLDKLPETFGNLENLQYLDLHRNDLNLFPESMKKLSKLKKLDLRGNFNLELFPGFIWKLPALEEVLVDKELERKIPIQEIQMSILEFLCAWKYQKKWNDDELKSVLKLRINGIPFQKAKN